MTFVGFDLHKRYITACALSDAGELIAEIRQLAAAFEAVRLWDFVSLSMMNVEKELPDIVVLGRSGLVSLWLCEQPSDHAAAKSH